MKQLTFDGAEVALENVAVRAAMPELTPTQKDVLEHVRYHGWISPKQAGLLLFAVQQTPWREPYASTDGTEVLKRLVARGLVRKTGRGRYEGV